MMARSERRAGFWQREGRSLLTVFLAAVVTPVGAYIGTLAVNRLQGIQIDPTAQIAVVVVSSIVVTAMVACVILIRENRRLKAKVIQVNELLGKESVHKAGSERLLDFIKVEDVSKDLTKDDPDLVVERWEDESQRVRVTYSAVEK